MMMSRGHPITKYQNLILKKKIFFYICDLILTTKQAGVQVFCDEGVVASSSAVKATSQLVTYFLKVLLFLYVPRNPTTLLYNQGIKKIVNVSYFFRCYFEIY